MYNQFMMRGQKNIKLRKLIVAFRGFANAPKNSQSLLFREMIVLVCDELCGQILEFYYLSSSARITGDWLKLHNEAVLDRYFPPNIIKSRRTNWVGEKISYKLPLVARPEGRRPLGRPSCWCDDEVKMVGGRACTEILWPKTGISCGVLWKQQ